LDHRGHLVAGHALASIGVLAKTLPVQDDAPALGTGLQERSGLLNTFRHYHHATERTRPRGQRGFYGGDELGVGHWVNAEKLKS
jgi:hypothetical protein